MRISHFFKKCSHNQGRFLGMNRRRTKEEMLKRSDSESTKFVQMLYFIL